MLSGELGLGIVCMGNCLRGELSAWGIVLVGNCPVGNCPFTTLIGYHNWKAYVFYFLIWQNIHPMDK